MTTNMQIDRTYLRASKFAKLFMADWQYSPRSSANTSSSTFAIRVICLYSNDVQLLVSAISTINYVRYDVFAGLWIGVVSFLAHSMS